MYNNNNNRAFTKLELEKHTFDSKNLRHFKKHNIEFTSMKDVNSTKPSFVTKTIKDKLIIKETSVIKATIIKDKFYEIIKFKLKFIKSTGNCRGTYKVIHRQFTNRFFRVLIHSSY